MKASGRTSDREVRVFRASMVCGEAWTSAKVVLIFSGSTTPFNSFFSCSLHVFRNFRIRSLESMSDAELVDFVSFSRRSFSFVTQSAFTVSLDSIMSSACSMCLIVNSSNPSSKPKAVLEALLTRSKDQTESSRPDKNVVLESTSLVLSEMTAATWPGTGAVRRSISLR